MTGQDKMQDCETYRQTIAADPWVELADGHDSQCAACREYRNELQALDRRIARALSLRVPKLEIPELDEIDATNVGMLRPRRRTMPAWLAVAATVLVAAVLAFRMLGTEISDPSLADEIIAHLEHEPYALRVTDRAVSSSRLARVVPASVATLDSSAGLITYAQSCVINGHDVPHLVIQGERGPVTILLMPEETVDAPQAINGSSIDGIILPVGRGSIAIIGEQGEDLERIKNSMRNSVAWTT